MFLLFLHKRFQMHLQKLQTVSVQEVTAVPSIHKNWISVIDDVYKTPTSIITQTACVWPTPRQFDVFQKRVPIDSPSKRQSNDA